MSNLKNKFWTPPVTSRNPEESHRQSTFLELFFDLCFVVAIAQAATELHHSWAHGHMLHGIIGFTTLFFAIWWAWMNFTWYASAFDSDDVPYRIAVFIQIVGALVIAAGVKTAFEGQNYGIMLCGYIIMRLGLVWLWIRAARGNTAHRKTATRYAIGIVTVQLVWSFFYFISFTPLWLWGVMMLLELLVPYWAEKSSNTPWHGGHIAERYGLLFIIALGESVLSSTNGLQTAINEHHAAFGEIATVVIGALLIIFSMWWLYFHKSSHAILKKNGVGFVWGYGHFFIFLVTTMIGAALAVNFEHATHHTEISNTMSAATVAIPVAIFLMMLWAIVYRYFKKKSLLYFLTASLLVLGTIFVPHSILLIGAITTILVVVLVRSDSKTDKELAKV